MKHFRFKFKENEAEVLSTIRQEFEALPQYRGTVTDRLGNNAAAAYLGVTPSAWRSYVAKNLAPPPDGIDEGFGKPYWLKSTLDTWKAGRKGRGWHGKRTSAATQDRPGNAP